MKIEIKKDITREVISQTKPLLIHKKGIIEFDGKILFIVGSNGSGKSTFGEWLHKTYSFDLFAPQNFTETNTLNVISDKFSSSGEKHSDRLIRFIKNSKTEYVILDEPEKSISLHGQVGLAHLIKDTLLEGKKLIIISHSYILLYFAEKNKLPIYDFDNKKIVKKYLPNL